MNGTCQGVEERNAYFTQIPGPSQASPQDPLGRRGSSTQTSPFRHASSPGRKARNPHFLSYRGGCGSRIFLTQIPGPSQERAPGVSGLSTHSSSALHGCSFRRPPHMIGVVSDCDIVENVVDALLMYWFYEYGVSKMRVLQMASRLYSQHKSLCNHDDLSARGHKDAQASLDLHK